MKAFLSFLLVLFLAPPLLAGEFRYVIDDKGIWFFDWSEVWSEKEWPRPQMREVSCSDVDRRISDPLSGRGRVVRECFSPYSPVGFCRVKTFDIDRRLWSRIVVLSADSEGIFGYCFRVWKDD